MPDIPSVARATSYRDRIMEAAKAAFRRIAVGEPVGDPRTIAWSVVERRPLADKDRGKDNALSILDTDEQKSELLEQKDCSLKVVLEWYSVVPTGVDFATHNNRVLLELQLTCMDPATWTDEFGEWLVINVQDRGSSLDVDSYASTNNRRVEGTLFLNVIYRHAQRDPRRYI